MKHCLWIIRGWCALPGAPGDLPLPVAVWLPYVGAVLGELARKGR